ncbi:MAG: hypothetical protein R2834_16455 [Rhodothermales bacterium]
MRTPGYLLLLIFLMLGCNTTERIVRLDSDTMPMTQSYNVNDLRARYATAPGVYVSYDHTLEHNVSIAFTSTIPHWRFFEVMQRSMVVLDPKSDLVNTFRVSVAPGDRLENVAITVQAPGSGGQNFDQDDLVEQPGPNGETLYTMSYGGIAAGTIVTESYEISYGDLEKDPPVYHDIPLQYALPAEQMNVRYIYPMWWQVQVKQLGAGQNLPYQRIEDADRRKIVLEYQAQNVPAFQPTQAAFFKESAPYFQIQVTNMSMGSAVRYRAPEDWESLGDSFAQYASRPKSRDEREVRDVTRQITGTLATQSDKVSGVLRYVADNITISPDARDRGIETMLSRREGTAFMATELAYAMLQEAGIDAEYLVLHSAADGFFDQTFYSDQQFRVPALNVFADGAEYVVIPGVMRTIADALPNEFAGQTAMVITDDGFGGFTQLTGERLASAGAIPVNQPAPQPVQTQPQPPVEQPPIAQPVGDPAPNRPSPVIDRPGPRNQPIDTPAATPVTPPPVADGGGIVGQPIGAQPSRQTPTEVAPPPVQIVPPPPAAATSMPEWMGSIDRSARGWTWVIGSKTTVEEAEAAGNEYLDLYRQGLKVDILSGKSNGTTRYRIAIGQYSSRNLAQIDRERLGSILPSDAWLLQIEPGM